MNAAGSNCLNLKLPKMPKFILPKLREVRTGVRCQVSGGFSAGKFDTATPADQIPKVYKLR